MIYKFLRQIAKWTLLIYFRKLYVLHADKIPKDRPMILAANHPTAFLEPCLFATMYPRELHFMVRGDMFEKKWLKGLLVHTNQIPIFRAKDGFSKLRNNVDIFDRCYKVLSEDNGILIFSESTTVLTKRLRPLKKGTAKMAFGALDSFPDLDLCILPVGVNYSDPSYFWNDVILDIGEPISVQDYFGSYKENPNEAIQSTTQELEKRMEVLVANFDDKDDEEAILQMQLINQTDRARKFSPKVIRKTDDRVLKDRKISRRFNQLDGTEKQALKERLSNYFSKIKNLGVSDNIIKESGNHTFQRLILSLLLFIPMLIATVIFGPPIKITELLVKKIVKKEAFVGSMKFSLGFPIFIFYGLIVLAVSMILFSYWGLLSVVLILIVAYYAVPYWHYFSDTMASLRYGRLENSQKEFFAKERNYFSQWIDKLG